MPFGAIKDKSFPCSKYYRLSREYDRMYIPMVEVLIRILDISLVKQNQSFVMSFVDEKRNEKASRFKNEKDQLLSLGAGYLMKKYLPSGEIKETESGKPYLKNCPFFNISHSGQYVALAIHPSRDIGIDIERIDEKKLDGIRYVLNQEEQKVVDTNTLFQIWSNKESLIKCLSSGLKDIKSVNGLPLEGERVVKGQNYFTKSMIYNGYSLAITLKEKEPFVVKIENINILEEQ